MFVVGLDLSINYPAICVSENFETFDFVGIINDPKISNVRLNYVNAETPKYDGVYVIDISDDRVTDPTYHVNERRKLVNFHRITSAIVSEIYKRTAGANVVIAMEGVSYGSKGSALLDICMLTGMVRRAMMVELLGGNADRLFVFSPSELKNAMGLKGNALKTEVLAEFIDNPGIEAARGCGMHALMTDAIYGSPRSTYVYNDNKDEICSPFNDMLDAYLSVLKLSEGAR